MENKITKINNTQRGGFVQVIKNKAIEGKYSSSTEAENAVKKALTDILKANAKDLQRYFKIKAELKPLIKRFKSLGLDVEYKDELSEVALEYRTQSTIKDKFLVDTANAKEKAITAIWSAQSLEEAQQVIDDFLRRFK